jgi:hypothetical protein
MCFSALFGGGDDSAQQIADQQRQDEVDRENKIKAGMASIDSAFSGFNDAYYKKRYNDYMAYATPQIDQQQSDARKQLIYALSRTGNLDSSAANDESSKLTQTGDQARLDAANAALNSENDLRSQVENTRSNLVSELNATGDADAASASALRQVQNLNQPAGFSPLANAFVGIMNTIAGIGSRAANSYSGFAGGSPVLFSSGGGSSRVVG